MYKEVKLEAKKVFRKAKNEEWVQLGKELEKDARGNQKRFWAKVNENRRSIESTAHTYIYMYDKNVEVLSEETEVIGRWKEHFEGLFQETDGPY